ncbi:hypothetical protein KKA69_04095 [Patescibacteria group bacterium]|nr:hypothetical protein [Patescibacteria group bacterium]
MNKEEEIERLLEKVRAAEKGQKIDLSSGEDLSVAVMNLISIEEHLFFSNQKTKDNKYIKLLEQIREMRKELLGRLIKNPEGEEWCISKHLLAGSMRLMEVGTKSLTKGDKKEAEEYFQMAYNLYEVFWALNLNLIEPSKLETGADEDKESTHSFMAKFGEIIKKAVDCCRE